MVDTAERQRNPAPRTRDTSGDSVIVELAEQLLAESDKLARNIKEDAEREATAKANDIIGEAEALIPAHQRGRYVPCRVIPNARQPALPAHTAGYLLVAIDGEESGGAAILEALARWQPGEFVEVRVRRNPYRATGSEWWESDVRMYLPE